MLNRIEKLMEDKKLTATQFSEEIGIQRSSVSHVLSGRNKPSLDFMLKIKLRYPETNLDWLLLGKGNRLEDVIAEKPFEQKIADEPKSEEKLPEFGLFSDITSEPDPGNKNEGMMARSEDAPSYNRKTDVLDKTPEKVIILYNDKTFSVYSTKG